MFDSGVACNTASAAALYELRHLFPGVPFVGMEPAVEPATALTRTGVVGVLGCTHYSWVMPVIRDIVGNDITIVGPAPAVARRVRMVWRNLDHAAQHVTRRRAPLRLFTTGDPRLLRPWVVRVTDIPVTIARVHWHPVHGLGSPDAGVARGNKIPTDDSANSKASVSAG